MDDMNNSRLWAQDFRHYKQLIAMVDINDF